MVARPLDHFDHVQHELALLSRRTEHIRLAALEEARSPLDRSGYLLLAHLADAGAMTMSQLAAAFDLDASTITRQVMPLERRGYATRDRSATDRRATVVSVTASGRAERELVRAARRSHVERRLETWSPDDVKRLATMLDRLNETLVATPFSPA